MNSKKIIGSLCAVFSAISFGLSPFFGLMLYRQNMTILSVLFYRFAGAALLMALYMLAIKRSFVLPKKYWFPSVISGILVAFTCLFWFLSFNEMDSGIAATILFIYPVMVAVIMAVGFREKISASMLIGMITAIIGVIFLCQTGTGKVNAAGVIYVLISALSFSLYMVFVKTTNLKELDNEKLTFYSMLFSLPIFLIPLRFGASLETIPSFYAWLYMLGLAFISSLLSYWLAAIAIKHIGPTRTSILGALEPATAVVFGVTFFHEEMSLKLAFGIVLIVASVIVVVCGNRSSAGKNGSDPIRQAETL